jgi:hypothetical protein
VVDFKYNRFLTLPDGTLPEGNAPYGVTFKHGDITNPTGGILGSGEYSSKNSANAIRRSGNKYVNYFWDNDLQSAENTYAPENVVSFLVSSKHKQVSAINGVVSTVKENATRFSSPINTTIGKTFGEKEYLNGELYFLYINEGAASQSVSIKTGKWEQSAF